MKIYKFFSKKLPNQTQSQTFFDGVDLFYSLNYTGRFNEWFVKKVKKFSLIENEDFFREKGKNNKITTYINFTAVKKILDIPNLTEQNINALKKEKDLQNLAELLTELFKFDKDINQLNKRKILNYNKNSTQNLESIETSKLNETSKTLIENSNKLVENSNRLIENSNILTQDIKRIKAQQEVLHTKEFKNLNEFNINPENENLMNKFNIWIFNSLKNKNNLNKNITNIYDFNEHRATDILYSFILLQQSNLNTKTAISITDLWLNIKKNFINPQQIHNINFVLFYKIQIFLDTQKDNSTSETEKFLFQTLNNYFYFFYFLQK